MRTPSPSWCGLDRTHLWPTGSSLGDPLITARNFSSCLSDSISRWTPCPPESASGGFRSALAVIRLSSSCPFRRLHTFHFSGQRGLQPRFWIRRSSSEHRRDLNLLINALLSAH